MSNDYFKEEVSQLSHGNVYEQLQDREVVSFLSKIVKSHLARVKLRGDIPSETFDYFINKNPIIGRFYLFKNNHKRLHNVPGRQGASKISTIVVNHIIKKSDKK